MAGTGALTANAPAIAFDTVPAAQAMANAFAGPANGQIPSAVSSQVAALPSGAPPGQTNLPGKVLVAQGRLLLSSLGPNDRAIYAFPTQDGEVCYAIDSPGTSSGLGEGCFKAFIAGEPATVGGGSFYFPPQSGPPGEIAGLTEDGVIRVQVVVNGVPHDAVLGNDAWYYRFPDNQTPATDATSLIVTMRDGSTVNVPTRIVDPSSSS